MSAKRRNPFAGRWRIVWMENWDQDFVDLEVPGYFEFGAKGTGSFQFGAVQGECDCCVRDARLEFSWSGFDEMDEVSGRGWAAPEGGELQGHLYFHQGDDSAFRLVKA